MEYRQRNKVTIDVSTNAANGEHVNADISVGVYLVDSLQPLQTTNLINYLWLTSDLKGDIESPDYYFKNSGTDVEKTTDNLMLTQGWRKFKWEDILKNSKPFFKFLPEAEGNIITGKLLPKIIGLPAMGVEVYLSVPGKNFRFSNAVSST